METVGDRVREARQEKDLTMRQLAEAIGKKESYISELERGGIRKGSMLHKIAEVLAVDVGWLETGRGMMVREPSPATYLAVPEAPPDAMAALWRSYLAAPAATRAAVELLLLPARDRSAVAAAHGRVAVGIELLERVAMEAVAFRKTA